MNIDIISDLHIDQWDTSLYNKYPCGIISNHPINCNEMNKLDIKSKILIISGDIADDLDISIKYLNDLSVNYDKILYIDGNHEHVNKYLELYTTTEINCKINALSNPKIQYLPEEPYILNKTAFIGVCGWWDYTNMSDTERHTTYFNDWIVHMKKSDNLEFINNVYKRSVMEYMKIINLLEKYENNDEIGNIVLVTHTLPESSYTCKSNVSIAYNTQFSNIRNHLKDKYGKVSHWIFGHTHGKYNKTINNVHYICNPRGRPDDYNRINYNPIQILI